MYKFLLLALLSFILSALNPVDYANAQVDSSAPLLCVSIEITQCDAGGDCFHGTAEDVNLPNFMIIHL